MSKEKAEMVFDEKYLPLLKQMYCCGFNDAIRNTIEMTEEQLWASKHIQKPGQWLGRNKQ